MATIRGISNDQTVTATYNSNLGRIYIEQPNHDVIKIDSCNLQATLEALENLKRLMTATLGVDSLK